MTGPPTTQPATAVFDAAARKPKRTLSGMARPERTLSGGLLREPQELPSTAEHHADGELTLEEYRQQLEAYISNTAQHEDHHGDGNHDDGEASDLEDDWEKEREKNFASAAPGRRVAPGRQRSSRGVDRAKSGVSMMSIATTKSGGGMSMVSGFTNLSDLMSATGDDVSDPHVAAPATTKAARDPNRGVDRNQSNLSIMSELTDLSANIDNLSLYED